MFWRLIDVTRSQLFFLCISQSERPASPANANVVGSGVGSTGETGKGSEKDPTEAPVEGKVPEVAAAVGIVKGDECKR